jgi:hypothetical protein
MVSSCEEASLSYGLNVMRNASKGVLDYYLLKREILLLRGHLRMQLQFLSTACISQGDVKRILLYSSPQLWRPVHPKARKIGPLTSI